MDLGIGFYQYTNCYGSPQATATALKALGCRWVIIKIGNGTADKGSATTATYPGAQGDAVKALTDAGLEVWGYHYIYGGVRYTEASGHYYSGASPAAEADFANSWANGLAVHGLKGYVINAEHEFKGLDQASRAKAFMDRLDVKIPVALSSYRYPTVHKEFPWGAFYASGKIAYHMPQVYQDDGAGQAVKQLTRCIDEYNSYPAIPKLPIVPTGRAYLEGVYKEVKAAEISGFIEECKRRGFSGCSFWVLDHYKNKPSITPEVNAAFKASPWPAVQPPADNLLELYDMVKRLIDFADDHSTRLDALEALAGAHTAQLPGIASCAADAMLRAGKAEASAERANTTGDTVKARLQAWEQLVRQGPV